MNLLEWISELQPFKSVDDIPDTPSFNTRNCEQWNKLAVPFLIKYGAIPKKSLIVGKVYSGKSKSTNKAMWTGSCFVYKEHDYGHEYEKTIDHFEDNPLFDMFIPLKEL